ncbi:hypothetical protein ACFLYP_03820 [Chloroflexota bacterium]
MVATGMRFFGFGEPLEPVTVDQFIEPAEVTAEAQQVIIVETSTPAPTAIPTTTPTPVPAVEQIPLYSPGQQTGAQNCPFCTAYRVKIRFTNYWPLYGRIDPEQANLNCYDWNEETQWCDSPTFSGIPWETAIGWGAACPFDWPIGTWIQVPNYGAVQCVDRGSMVCIQTQEGTLCEVDILAEEIGAINGQILEALVYIYWGDQ